MDNGFRIRRRVRFGDCDPGGVLYTPNISFYIVESVREFMDYLLGSPMEKALLGMAILPPAKSLTVEFTSFMKWDDELDIDVKVKHVGNSSFTFLVTGFCRDASVFNAEFTQVCVDPVSKRPTSMPQALRDALNSQYMR